MWVFWILGVILNFISGCISITLWNLKYHGYGEIDVDPETQQ